jgi:hypothetical protein
MVRAIREGRVAVEEPHRRLSRLLDGFDFRSAAREELSGRPALRIDFAPRGGGPAEAPEMRRMSGRLWADEAEGRLVKVEVRNDAPIRVGLGGGTSISALAFTAEFRRVDDEVWLPTRVETWASGRVLLVKGFRVRRVEEYSGYRRFEVGAEEQVHPPR